MGILLVGTGTYLYIGNNNKEETKKEELKWILENNWLVYAKKSFGTIK